MALVVGGRIGLITYTLGTDPRPGRIQHNEERNLLESRLVIGDQGTSAARPTAGKGKALYWNTDRNVLQWDTSTGWEDISTVGGGGVPANVAAAGTATEGVSQRGARADHVHVLPLATTTTHGAMSSGDKTKLDNAVVTATGSRLVIRDVNGRAQFASPAASADVATKGYVDSVVGGAAAPVVTAENNGLATPAMLAATDEVALAVSSPDAHTLVIRDVNGRAQFGNPSVANDAANKSYVDGQIGSHRHDGTHITTGTIAAARLPIASTTANGAMSTADKTKLDASTPSATNATLVMRDSNGRSQFANPSVAADVATKGYVDAADSGKAPNTHYHAASDITSGTMPATRLPYASAYSDGILNTTDYSRISNHTHDASAINTGMMSAARLPAASSSASGIISAGTYSTIYNHSHHWDSITSKPSSFWPSAHSHATATSTSSGFMPTDQYNLVANAHHTVIGWGLVRRWSSGTFHVPDPSADTDVAGRRYVNSRTSRREWKTNERPMPYGLAEMSALGELAMLFDYRDEETTPESVRGQKNELGVYVEDAEKITPLLVTYSEEDGRPERVQDRALTWPILRALHEVDARLTRIENHLGLGPLAEGD